MLAFVLMLIISSCEDATNKDWMGDFIMVVNIFNIIVYMYNYSGVTMWNA